MKKLLFSIGLISMFFDTFAQQLPQYSQYFRNQFMANPASAGMYDFTDVTLSGRSQWTGLENSPVTSYLSVAAPLSTDKVRYNPGIRTGSEWAKNPEVGTGKLKHAIGGQLLADQYGAFRKVQLSGTYAIHIPLSKTFNLSFGTKVGLSSNTFIQSRAVVNTPTLDNTYIDYIANQADKKILNIGTGLYLYSNKMYFGISADQLTKNLVNFGHGSTNFDPRMYFNAMGGIKLNVTKDFTITPSVIVKYMRPAPVSIEGTVQLEYKEAVWAAVSYRNADAIIGMIGMNINKTFKVSYSYDYTVSRLADYNKGGHELILGIMLGRNK